MAKWIQLLFYAPHFIATCMEMELNFFPPFFSSTKKITIDIGSSRPVSRESFRLLKIGLKLLLVFKKIVSAQTTTPFIYTQFCSSNYIHFPVPLVCGVCRRYWSSKRIVEVDGGLAFLHTYLFPGFLLCSLLSLR